MEQALRKEIPEAAIDAYVAGTELAQDQKYEEAVPYFMRALEIFRYYPSAMLNLGTCFINLNKFEAALAALDMARIMEPAWPELEYNYGLLNLYDGKFDIAEGYFRAALALKPHYREADLNLGVCMSSTDRIDDAIAQYQKMIESYPDYPEPYVNLGTIFSMRKNRQTGLALIYRACELSEYDIMPSCQYAEMLASSGRPAEAVEVMKKSLEKNPDHIELRRLQIVFMNKAAMYDEAKREIDIAMAEFPEESAFMVQRGGWHQDQGETDEMAAYFIKAGTSDDIRHVNLSTLLFGINYISPDRDRELFEMFKNYGKKVMKDWEGVQFYYKGNRDSEKPLRIGYISGDFREHSVSYFVEALFRHHDRARYTPVVFQEGLHSDARTTLLRSWVDEWHETHMMGDAALARKIADLNIDVLVDLSGHTSHHRLPVFAVRAAPVQVNWLGFPNTTGVANMDYRIVDHISDPVNDWEDAFYTEKRYRLDRCFLCYSKPDMTPDPRPRLSVADGKIIFGSFNNPSKINKHVLGVWSRILHEIPNSRLFIKGRQFGTPSIAQKYIKQFESFDAPLDRIDLVSQMPSTFDHLNVYNEVDVALDCFPYTGTTTTCEAMLMGVPVITMTGNAHRHRVSASLLHAVGLDDLIARDADEYVAIARKLAADPDRIINLRHNLRQQMLESSLCDKADFTRHMEQAYRTMWREFAHSDRFRV